MARRNEHGEANGTGDVQELMPQQMVGPVTELVTKLAPFVFGSLFGSVLVQSIGPRVNIPSSVEDTTRREPSSNIPGWLTLRSAAR